MGLFDDFKRSLAESPGRILLIQLQETQQKLAQLSATVSNAALLGFVNKRERILPELDNMTSIGRIQMGKSLQAQARKTIDLNIAEGYALWLAGAWLESMERPGLEAAKVHHFLNVAAEGGGRYL